MVAVELDTPVSASACVIESMKMENDIRAHPTGMISGLWAVMGSSVAPGDTLASITADSRIRTSLPRKSLAGDPGGDDDGHPQRALRAPGVFRTRSAHLPASWQPSADERKELRWLTRPCMPR